MLSPCHDLQKNAIIPRDSNCIPQASDNLWTFSSTIGQGTPVLYNTDSEMVEVTGFVRDGIAKDSGGCGEYSGINNGMV